MKNQTRTGYFHRVMNETPTEFWINNATPAEAKDAIEAGAVSASTNPTYPSRLLKVTPDYINGIIDEVISEIEDDDKAADIIYQKAVSRLQKLFYPIYKRTNGRYGYVAIQGDPRLNRDSSTIIAGALQYRELGENIIIKVPATPAGAAAMEILTANEHPTIATLGFSIDQAIFMAEAHQRGLAKSKTNPVCYITSIAGILDEYLSDIAEQMGNSGLKELILYAGCAVTRATYKIFKARGFKAYLVGGGARGTHHFSELIGGEMAITIGWSLAERLLAENLPIKATIFQDTPQQILHELEMNLPDFRKAFNENSMSPEEFYTFGPVVSFQNVFLKGVNSLLEAITNRRTIVSLSVKSR
ncbi:MAG: transaldolase family protein [Spirochaetota bacterium]